MAFPTSTPTISCKVIKRHAATAIMMHSLPPACLIIFRLNRSDAQEKQVLTEILHNFRIKGDADNSCAFDDRHDDGKDDS